MKVLEELKERIIRVAVRKLYNHGGTTTSRGLSLPRDLLRNIHFDEIDMYAVVGKENEDILILHFRQKEEM